MIDSQELITIFDKCFSCSLYTQLRGGADEPIYTPIQDGQPLNTIYFRSDYVSSALHEVAHWCVAGEHRRTLTDYGYWYAPDGRTQQQQADFEKVEVKPQALEWFFSNIVGVPFSVSADNLSLGLGASDVFKCRIYEQVQSYSVASLPVRASQFAKALSQHSVLPWPKPEDFKLDLLK